jgi:hypothetical protein
MALSKKSMIEKQSINGKDVWVQVNSHHVERPNPNIIPTEYFTASYFLNEPDSNADGGKAINDEEGKLRLFESPVAALSFTRKALEKML